jgi:hypothetical protein
VGLTTSRPKNKLVTKCHKGPRLWTDFLDKRTKLRKIDTLIWLRIGTGGGTCEHGNKPSGFIKYWEVLELLNDWQLFKKGSAP